MKKRKPEAVHDEPQPESEGREQSAFFENRCRSIRTFIDLTEQHETDGYAVALQWLAEERGMEAAYLHFPICDRSVPSAWVMGRILDVIDRAVADGRTVFVHCFVRLGIGIRQTVLA